MNNTLSLTTSHTLRLNKFSIDRWIEKCHHNLDHLYKLIYDTYKNGYGIFRIGSGVIPFATHPILYGIDWKHKFGYLFSQIANLIHQSNIRITMHPDQFVVINSNKLDVYMKSVQELQYHADMMDLLELDSTCKMQIHGGGVYNQKQNSINLWIDRYLQLPTQIKNRLVLENDDFSYSLTDVMYIHSKTKIPILFDTLHHECLNPTSINHHDAFKLAYHTWKSSDGIPLVDYSSQQPNSRKGKHASTIDLHHFDNIQKILDTVNPYYDVILEIKDKEVSAHKLSICLP